MPKDRKVQYDLNKHQARVIKTEKKKYFKHQNGFIERAATLTIEQDKSVIKSFEGICVKSSQFSPSLTNRL